MQKLALLSDCYLLKSQPEGTGDVYSDVHWKSLHEWSLWYINLCMVEVST